MSTGAKRRLGVVSLGRAFVGFDIDAIREVVPAPDALQGLALPDQVAQGAIDLRGAVIPVVDLASRLGLAGKGQTRSSIAILSLDGRVVGVGVDGVLDVLDVPAESIQPVKGSDWVEGVFAWKESGRSAMVSIVGDASIRRSLDLPWVVEPKAPSEGRGDGDVEHLADEQGRPSGRASYLVVKACDLAIGIPAEVIHSSHENPSIRGHFLQSGSCLGVTQHEGRDLPVVDLLRHLGAGVMDGRHSRMVVVRVGGGLVGLLVHEVLDVAAVRRRDVFAVPPGAVQRTERFDGAADVGGGVVAMLLNRHELGADEGLRGLAFTCQESEAERVDASSSVRERRGLVTGGFIAFSAAGRWVAPLRDVGEVIDYPALVVPSRDGHPYIRGVITLRGRPVTLMSLSGLIGGVSSGRAESQVVMIRGHRHSAAFAVESLDGIEPFGSFVGEGAKARDAQAVMGVPVRLVEMGQSEGGPLASCLDLRALVDQAVESAC